MSDGLAAGHEQMTRDFTAKLHAVEQDILDRISQPPPAAAPARKPVPRRRSRRRWLIFRAFPQGGRTALLAATGRAKIGSRASRATGPTMRSMVAHVPAQLQPKLLPANRSPSKLKFAVLTNRRTYDI
jgi:hypothetical protein